MFLSHFGILKRIFSAPNSSAQSVYDAKAQLFAIKKQFSLRIKKIFDDNINQAAASFEISPRQIKAIIRNINCQPLSSNPTFDSWLEAFIASKIYFYKNLITIQNKFGLSADILDTIEAEVQIAQQLARNRCSSVFKMRLTVQATECKNELEHKHLSPQVKTAIKKLASHMRVQEKQLLQSEDELITHILPTEQHMPKYHALHGHSAS
jgi:hypothetical protein